MVVRFPSGSFRLLSQHIRHPQNPAIRWVLSFLDLAQMVGLGWAIKKLVLTRLFGKSFLFPRSCPAHRWLVQLVQKVKS